MPSLALVHAIVDEAIANIEGGGAALTVTDGTTEVDEVTELRAAVVIDDEGTAVILPVVISETEPDPGAGNLWLRTQDNGNSYQLYVRANDDSFWISVGAGVTDNSETDFDGADKQVGFYQGENGNFIGLEVDALQGPQLFMTTDDSTIYVRVLETEVRAAWSNGIITRAIALDEDGVKIPDLPTSNPNVADTLWNDGGTLKVSAG